ncbi:MAG: glycoside hydrolase family 88 protein [Eubacteriales bacterium]
MKKFEEKREITSDEVATALKVAVSQVERNIPDYSSQFKACVSVNGVYPKTENVDWTTGFWTGEIWLAYEESGNEALKTAALEQVDSFLHRIENKIQVEHHDMGFLFSLSCVAAYQLTGSETGKKAGILAAEHLISRYHEKAKFIQAWGAVGEDGETRLIIDCLLNVPLLYWATEVTKEQKYADIATNHIKTSLDTVIREDFSTYHTFFFDKEGKPSHGVTRQGYRDDSAWSRGQAWGIYGTALAYRSVPDPKYFDIFYGVTDYFLSHLPSNLIPYWDFTFTDGSEEPWDSSAAVIAVCGMLEMSKYLPQEKANYYTSMAKKILLAVVENCSISNDSNSNGQINMGTYARKSPFNPCNDRGLNECNTWGDFFYLEALTRLTRDWNLYW